VQDWHTAFLGRRHLPREISALELRASFMFAGADMGAIELGRTAALQLGLALPLGFLRMCTYPLNAVGDVPRTLDFGSVCSRWQLDTLTYDRHSNHSTFFASRSITVDDVQTQAYDQDDCRLKSTWPSSSNPGGHLF